jgi:hypothetical protein
MNLNEDTQSDNTMNDNIIPEHLFVEKSMPANEPEPETQQKSKLTEFLDRDFQAIGYKDGYRYSNADVMDNAMRLIRCEFRETIDRMIEDCREHISKLQNQALELRHISLKAEEKVNARIVQIKETITKLGTEKENSAMDEGLIMKTIHLYRNGFIRGVNDNNDELLLMSYNGLFK